MAVKRGEIWWTDIPDPGGSEPGFDRPVVVVQNDLFTESRIATVICVILTTNLRLAQAPGNVLLKAAKTGLPRDSVANVSQVVTLDKRRFTEFAGSVPGPLMAQIEEGLRLVLDL
jgi:mRNA interferase MazF